MNLVTGGAGFIGTHLVQELLNAGESVRVLERPGSNVKHLPLDKIELVEADIRDRNAVNEATRGCDYVYHLAADPNLWRRDPAEFDAINFTGAMNVIETALANGARRVLHTSTESILTSADCKGGSVEHLELKEEDMVGPYCLSKCRSDMAAMQMAKSGAPVIIVSPTLPVGPGDRNLTPPTRMALAFCKGEIPAVLDCKFNLIDVRDVATGLVAAMQKGRPGIRYLLGSENHRLSEWLGMLGKYVNRPEPKYRVPYPLALSVAWFSEAWANHVTHEMPLATVTGVKLTRRSMFFDPSMTLNELQLRPRPISQSAEDTVAWLRAEQLI